MNTKPLLYLSGPSGRIAIVRNKVSAIADAAHLQSGSEVRTQVYTDQDSDPFNILETFEEVCALWSETNGE